MSNTESLKDKIEGLESALRNRQDIGLITAGSDYRIMNRSTGEILEICHTEEYARKALEKYR